MYSATDYKQICNSLIESLQGLARHEHVMFMGVELARTHDPQCEYDYFVLLPVVKRNGSVIKRGIGCHIYYDFTDTSTYTLNAKKTVEEFISTVK